MLYDKLMISCEGGAALHHATGTKLLKLRRKELNKVNRLGK